MQHLPRILSAVAILWIAIAFLPPSSRKDSMDLVEFGNLPVLSGGRIKPLDSIARTSLLIAHGKQELRMEDGSRVSAAQWITDLLLNPAVADDYPTFLIHNTEVLGLVGLEQSNRKHFSFNDLHPHLEEIERQGLLADKIESVHRSAFETAIFNLRNRLFLYQRIKNSIAPESAQDFVRELNAYESAMVPGLEAMRLQQLNEPFEEEAAGRLGAFVNRYEVLSAMAYAFAVPPLHDIDQPENHEWLPVGESLLRSLSTGEVDPVVHTYASMTQSYRDGNVADFNRSVRELSAWMATSYPEESRRAGFEFFFNHVQPFHLSMVLYAAAFLLACASWLGYAPRPLASSAFWLIAISLVVHTFGLAARMYLQDRPPVTNLYSSAIFIGWGTVILGLILERIFRDGIGAAAASAVGFATLIVARHLAGSGDTLEMLRAVLDTNFWLATHVIIITAGYSAMFLAGFLAILYVVRGLFTKTLSTVAAQSLSRMVYGILCFATLFSFVGTVLGGIWADQSWGRFWGWDPKENGALMIVIWCALILHARWGGFIKARGMMAMAIFGNVITSFSWFGTNMLGIGLHSYGFMDKGFPWLIGFMLSQMVFIAICAIPLTKWRSFGSPEAQV